MKITTLTDRRKAIFDKIMARVIIDNNTGCWNWTGPTSGNGRGGGYGRMCLDSQTVSVHIVMFTNFFGFVPGKKQIDHKCNNRSCCNPDHLEMVTHLQNQKRRASRGRLSDDHSISDTGTCDSNPAFGSVSLHYRKETA
jgi:hypothetical protein